MTYIHLVIYYSI